MIRQRLQNNPLPSSDDINCWENIEFCMLCLDEDQFNLLMPKETKTTQVEAFTKQIDDPVMLEMEKAFQSGDMSSLETLMSSFDKKE